MSDEEAQDEQKETNYAFGKKFKHTLDSDEEDDEVDAEKYNIIDNEAIEGTERSTIEFDGDIKITPFNMDEELQDGHFDKEGTYIFKKEANSLKDNWLDNINWDRIQQDKNENISESDDEDNDLSETKIKEFYEEIIKLIHPGESIQKAIQRYGKEGNTYRKGQKRKHNTEKNSNSENNELKEKMLKLISFADKIMQTGDMDIYERTYEYFQLKLNKMKESTQSTSFDMFSDNFDVKTTIPLPSTSKLENEKVQWQYKWEDKDDAVVYGPYSSEDMLAWANQGFFENGVFVRKLDSTDSKFYNSKRIDFELYV